MYASTPPADQSPQHARTGRSGPHVDEFIEATARPRPFSIRSTTVRIGRVLAATAEGPKKRSIGSSWSRAWNNLDLGPLARRQPCRQDILRDDWRGRNMKTLRRTQHRRGTRAVDGSMTAPGLYRRDAPPIPVAGTAPIARAPGTSGRRQRHRTGCPWWSSGGSQVGSRQIDQRYYHSPQGAAARPSAWQTQLVDRVKTAESSWHGQGYRRMV